MTEDEWLQSDSPGRMLLAENCQLSTRKLQMLAACLGGAALTDSPCAAYDDIKPKVETHCEAMKLAERGVKDLERLADGEDQAGALRKTLLEFDRLHPTWTYVSGFVRDVIDSVIKGPASTQGKLSLLLQVLPQRVRHSDAILIVKDLVGNPFRPVAFDTRWRTSNVVGLARAIYDDRAFERMPILADALMDAGCENEEIIGHCRGDGPHVRGCWVVDLVLGKE